MANTLPISMLINVDLDYQPTFIRDGNFGRLCIIGNSTNTRGTQIGVYYNLAGVADHYAESTNEYKIATKLFAQIPRPKQVMIATVDELVFPIAEG